MLCIDHKLQWGHGREAMDGSEQGAKVYVASPLQWGHGREAMDGPAPPAQLPPPPALQWGHGREAMDGLGRGPGRTCHTRFNGAMAVRPWMG